jgi:integral membrane sensor domain MASE1
MFVSGEWLTSKEGLGGEDDPAWFVIGILVGDLAGLLLAVSIVLAAIASWKSKARLGRLAGAVAALALLLCLVGVWAMTAKPS